MTTGKNDAGGRSGARGETDIDGPRLTPQGRTAPTGKGEDSTDPTGEGAAKKGQSDKAEG